MSDPSDLLEAENDAVFFGEDVIPPLAPSESGGATDTGPAWTADRVEDAMLPNRYDVPFASTDAPGTSAMSTSARGAANRWKTSSSAAEFYPRTRPGAPTRSVGAPAASGTATPRHRLASMVVVAMLLAGLLGAFAVKSIVTFPRLRLGTATSNGPQRVPAGETATSISVPRTATTGRGYVLTVPAGFSAESPALDGSDVSLVSAGTGTFLGVVSHQGAARPALLVNGTAVHTRIAGIAASGVTTTKQGRVTRAIEFRHDDVWYVVTESADAPAARAAFAGLAKTLQDWHFSAAAA